MATGKELTEIEKVEREFARAWKEYGQTNANAEQSAIDNPDAVAPTPSIQLSVSEEADSNNPLTGIDKYSQKRYNSDKDYEYTEEQYNSFGWARDAGAITKNELDDMYSKLHVKGSLKKFTQTYRGEAIVELNDSPHTTLGANNVIAFVTGTKNDPKITRVVRIDLFDEDLIDIIRKDIYDNTDYRALQTYADRMGEDILRYYNRDDYADYSTYKGRTRTQRSGSEGEGNSPANRVGDQRNGAFAEAQANDIAPIKEVSSTDDAFFEGENTDTQYSLSSIANTFHGDPDMSSVAFEESDYKQTDGYKSYVDKCLNNMRQTRADFDEASRWLSEE